MGWSAPPPPRERIDAVVAVEILGELLIYFGKVYPTNRLEESDGQAWIGIHQARQCVVKDTSLSNPVAFLAVHGPVSDRGAFEVLLPVDVLDVKRCDVKIIAKASAKAIAHWIQ